MPACPHPLRPANRPLPVARACALGLAVLATVAAAQAPASGSAAEVAAWQGPITEMAQAGVRLALPNASRVEVVVGQLDPRLKLAPCQKIEPYLPPQPSNWGRMRVGLRCLQGSKRWNVSLPITVKAWVPALVVRADAPAGTVLAESHLSVGEVELSAWPGVVLRQPGQAVGRSLARGLQAGDALRQADLKSRQWFAAGDTVQVVAVGPGWQIVAGGQAMGPGLEDQPARVRMENGRVVQGRAVSDRRVEVQL